MWRYPVNEQMELRLLEEYDAPLVAAITGDSLARARAWIRGLRDLYQAGQEIPCGIWVGHKRAGYVLLEIHDHGEGLLHYGLVPPYRGQGVATRAGAALVEYAFSHQGLQVLKVDPPAAHVRSCRVAERLGFERVGTLCIADGEGGNYEVARYCLTRKEWAQSNEGC